ncbi:membrane-spanning 4-domains subfamily A member 4A-like [Salminus brasiliensis]|uniref:membrane-spanning 4-domains subfamily A member 4A-like n=1 Tax=Salminus brasiliensis TaxID=930266 RepID=UPI003B835B92
MCVGVKFLVAGAGLSNGVTQKHPEIHCRQRRHLLRVSPKRSDSSTRLPAKMRDEAEVEIIDSVEPCAGTQNHNSPSETGALVEVTFQKNPNQELKFLEAEPKALGVTQIMLSLFLISTAFASLQEPWFHTRNLILCGFYSVGLIAGSVTIAAQCLHLPKLKACLGMQIVACAMWAFCFVMNFGSAVHSLGYYPCWKLKYHNSSSIQLDICERLSVAYNHVEGLQVVVLAAQIAISVTLAAFCCKVIQCCSPRTSVPMIVVSAPSGPQ